MSEKVLCAMSGGVDSSVAALLLKKEGFDVVGVTMCLGVKKGDSQRPTCCGPEAITDARRVCEKLNIPHYVLDFSKEMQEIVIKNMVDSYSAGKTPNPCVRCNESLKFYKLFKYSRALGFDYLATGHYAKIKNDKGKYYLQQAKDKNKDQSYFLYVIKEKYLPFLLFPLGDLTKHQVRSIAKKEGLPVFDKPQSQDLCFISFKNNKRELFLGKKGLERGNVVDIKGNILSEHGGIANYTIGQRIGLGIATGKPLYVINIDANKNQIVVGEKKDTFANGLKALIENWIIEDYPDYLNVKIRHRHQMTRSKVKFIDSSYQKIEVLFDEPQSAIAPGQSVVFYKNDTICGGGIIEESL